MEASQDRPSHAVTFVDSVSWVVYNGLRKPTVFTWNGSAAGFDRRLRRSQLRRGLRAPGRKAPTRILALAACPLHDFGQLRRLAVGLQLTVSSEE